MISCIHKTLSRSANHALMIVLVIFSSVVQATNEDQYNPIILTIVPEYKDAITANFNPYSRSSMPTTHEFIFEPLIIFNTLQNNLPEYRLATHYHLDPDLKGISFILRQGVNWSDGTPFTADDVLFSFSIVQQHPELDSQGVNQWVKSIEKRSNHEVYFSLKKPNALIANALVMLPIVPKHQWETVTDFASFANDQPIGTGPFTQIIDLNETGYVQCANPQYWQASKRKIDCLRYPKVTNNDDFMSRIVTGEFDWSGSFIPDIERHYASVSPHFKYWLPPASNLSLMFNFKAADPEVQKLFNQVSFRRAISMSIQRQLLIDIAAFGQGEPSRYASGISERFKQWIDPVSTEKYLPYMTFNPQLAASLLDDLGIIDHTGDGWRDRPSGEALSLSLITPNGWSDFNITALLVSEMMGRIGIKVNTVQTDFDHFVEQLTLGNYQLTLTNYPQGPTPFRYFDVAFNSAYQAPQYPRYAMHFYHDQQINKLLAQFPIAATPHQRLDIIQSLNQIVASKQITVPLYHTVQFYQYNTQRFEGWFSKENPVASPLAWPQSPERLLHVLALKPVTPVKSITPQKSAEAVKPEK